VVDRTTNKTWATFHPLGVQSVGSLTWKIPSGLTSNTWFWYTYYASNTVGDAWATTSMPFKTYGAPGVDSASGASPIGQTTATLNGTLTNGVSATVILLYGTNQNSWAFTNNIGTKTEGAFALPVTGLLPATTYWYICYAMNTYGNALTTPTNFTTTPAFNYNDAQNGNFDNPATWSSSNGGTNYPQGADTAVIDSNIVTQDLSNVSGTLYLNPNGLLRHSVYANAVQATLHLNGGLFWLAGGASWRASTPVDIFVDADSTITNNDTANVDMNPITLHGTNRLTLYKPGGSLLALYLSSNNTFSGTFQLGAGATVELGNTNGAPLTEVPPAVANSAIDLHGVNAQIGTNNTTLLTGDYNNLLYQAKITGNGRIISAYHGYSGKWCIFTNGAMIAPGTAGTNAAGTIWLGFDRVVFATNSEYQCDIADTNSADMLDCVNGDAVVTPVEIDPGAKLTVTFWTPTQAVTNLSVDILRTTSFVAGTNLFTVAFKNTNRWSNVAVNYDTNSLPQRVYVTAASYTLPSPSGTVFYIR